jgi:hypothetical protein
VERPHIFIASYNTRVATELAIRSVHRFAGCPFHLTVGDSASADGSRSLLEQMEADGWLQLMVSDAPRSHAEWLDTFLDVCTSRYAIWMDSDIELRRPGVVRDLVIQAASSQAAIIGTEGQPAVRTTTHDGVQAMSTGRKAAIWLTIVDVPVVKSLGYSYAPLIEAASDGDELPLHYDVGSRIEKAVEDAGYAIIAMPVEFQRSYRHFRGLSWRREPGIRMIRHYLRYSQVVASLFSLRRDQRYPYSDR